MLQIFRNKAQSSFAIIIVAIIILVFVFWGVGSNMLNNHQAALVVNGQEVSFADYQRVHDATSERMSQQFGGNVPKGMGELVKNQVINQLIRDALIRQGASEMGIIVNDGEVRTLIEAMPQFQKDGMFSFSLYKEVLAANRITPIQFEERIKKDRLLQLTIEKINDFAAPVSDFEIEDIYSQLNEQVAVQYAVFPAGSYEDKVTIDEKDLSSWFEREKETYKTAPKYNFRYITFLYEDIGGQLEFDKETLKNYYEKNKDSFTVPEQRSAAHILIQTDDSDSEELLAEKRARAERILQMARQEGQDFAALAKEYSEGPSAEEGGNLGTFTRGQMVPSFDEAVFSMEEGAVSGPVKTRFGFHIISLAKIIPAREVPFSEAENEIRNVLQKREAESMAFQMANSTYEGIIANGSLDGFAKEHPDTSFKTSGFVTQLTAPSEIAGDAQFLQQSFALGDKELSSLVKGDTGYGIFYVEEMSASEIPSLGDIREQAEQDYRQAQAKILAKGAAEAFLAEVKQSGADLVAAAQKAGIPLEDSGWLGHNTSTNNSSFPADLVAGCFALSKTAPLAREIGETEGHYYVYRLMERKIPVMEKDSPERSFYQENLHAVKQQRVFTSWLQSLWSKAKVRKHESL